jgi:hypothetical protein
MPRRSNAAKRLNNSTDPKVETQRETSQKQERVEGGQPSQQPQHRMLTSDISMRNTSQNAAGGTRTTLGCPLRICLNTFRH